MQRQPVNPSLIRNYQFVINSDGTQLVQFIAFGNKNRLVRDESGQMAIVREQGQGKPYKCGSPLPIETALQILSQDEHPSHADMATHIKNHANQ